MESETPCVFCEIVHGRAPATVVRDWPHALAIVPLDPVPDGHVLVLPKDHSQDFTTGSEALLWAMMGAASLAREIGGDVNMITSKGPNATQTVFHLHLHLIPRYAGDGITLPWTPAMPALPPVDDLARVINEALMGYAPGTFDGVENGAWNAVDDEIDAHKIAARIHAAAAPSATAAVQS